jgi:hypothetical protein
MQCQVKLGFGIVTGTLTVTSNWSLGSAYLRGKRKHILKGWFTIYPFTRRFPPIFHRELLHLPVHSLWWTLNRLKGHIDWLRFDTLARVRSLARRPRGIAGRRRGGTQQVHLILTPDLQLTLHGQEQRASWEVHGLRVNSPNLKQKKSKIQRVRRDAFDGNR